MDRLWDTTKADRVAYWLPIGAAILAIATGVLALVRYNNLAASLGIASGIASAVGVVATGYASKLRDDQLRFWIDAIGEVQSRSPADVGFGG